MYVIDVIPLSRTAPGVLSYRSSKELPVGSVVDIILRKTAAQGIVVACMPVTHAKEMLKNARFLLSRSAPSASGILPKEVMEAAKNVAEQHATTIGAVLVSLFGEYIKSNASIPAGELVTGSGYARECIEKSVNERVSVYTSILERNEKNNSAVLLVVPTIAECLFWKEQFASHKPLILSGSLTAAKRMKALEAASLHTGLIIATPSFSWTPITSLGHIIVDRISAGTYTLPKRPYIDVVQALESLAEARSIPISLTDYPLPLEFRADSQAIIGLENQTVIFDARKNPDDQKADDTPWAALPEPIMQKIAAEIESKGRVVVLAARSGYAPAVVCRDCGQALTDERNMPLSFTTANGKRMFRSSDGKTLIDARMKCPRCDSWNLLPLGVGQERVIEELRKQFPSVPIVEASSESLRSPAAAKKLLLESNQPGVITVGGEALLPWLLLARTDDTSGKKPLGVIASADSLLSLPFWRARERFVRLAYLFNTLCSQMVLITRHPEDAAVDAVVNPASTHFWQEERMLREALNYPPYGTLITLTLEGSPQSVSTLREQVVEDLALFAPAALPEQKLSPLRVRLVLVLSLASDTWPETKLSSILQTLSPSIRVRINPESLW